MLGAAGKGLLPVDKDEVKGVPCFRGDTLPDPGQHRDPRLRVECDPRVCVGQARVSIGDLLPGNLVPRAKHLQFCQVICLNDTGEGSNCVVAAQSNILLDLQLLGISKWK